MERVQERKDIHIDPEAIQIQLVKKEAVHREVQVIASIKIINQKVNNRQQY